VFILKKGIMKNLLSAGIVAIFCLLTSTDLSGQTENKSAAPDPDKMTVYYMAMLKSGPVRDHDSATAAKIQEAHMGHIMKMAAEKKLVLAGPFLDNGELRGIFIFNVASIEEAEALTNQDPAVQAGRLVMEIHPWYGPAILKDIKWD
jgi:uncharacterized protein YciI